DLSGSQRGIALPERHVDAEAARPHRERERARHLARQDGNEHRQRSRRIARLVGRARIAEREGAARAEQELIDRQRRGTAHLDGDAGARTESPAWIGAPAAGGEHEERQQARTHSRVYLTTATGRREASSAEIFVIRM